VCGVDSIGRYPFLPSLRAVDELVFAVIEALAKTDRLRNTFIVFSSDNGFHLGQHRLASGKQTAYDEDIRVPLIIRGPGIPARELVDELGLETDLAPTFAEWAGVTPLSFVDGRSLVPLLRRQAGLWRNGVLIEQQPGPEPFMSRVEKIIFEGKFPVPNYAAVRSKSFLYVEYANGERELYNVKEDPAQLRNVFNKADPELIRRLSAWLSEMKLCSGALCREREEIMPDRKS
jgi:N-acetylglucosamine-6-sulfatase